MRFIHKSHYFCFKSHPFFSPSLESENEVITNQISWLACSSQSGCRKYEGQKVILRGNFAISDIDISIFLLLIVVVVVVFFFCMLAARALSEVDN